MNDRFASVAPDVAQLFFQQLWKAYQQEKFAPNKVFNPETYLMATYVDAGIRVLEHKYLKGVSKLIQTAGANAAFVGTDVDDPLCPEPDQHRKYLVDLYGWEF